MLIAGMFILLVGVVLSLLDWKPYSDYVLLAGAALVIMRGTIRRHENE